MTLGPPMQRWRAPSSMRNQRCGGALPGEDRLPLQTGGEPLFQSLLRFRGPGAEGARA